MFMLVAYDGQVRLYQDEARAWTEGSGDPEARVFKISAAECARPVPSEPDEAEEIPAAPAAPAKKAKGKK